MKKSIRTRIALFLLLSLFTPIQAMRTSCAQLLSNSTSVIREKTFYQEGFAAETCIHTPHGMKPIELIQQGDQVFSYDHIAQKYRRYVVLKTHQQQCSSSIALHVGHDVIESHGDQKFLDECSRWRYLKDLIPGQKLMALDKTTLPITKIATINQAKILYALSLQTPHNFAVGTHKIIAHNLGFTYVIGSCEGFKTLKDTVQVVDALGKMYTAFAGTAAVVETGAAAGTAVTGTGVVAAVVSNPIGWAFAAGSVIYAGVKGYKVYKKAKKIPEHKLLGEVLKLVRGGSYNGDPNDPRDPWRKLMDLLDRQFAKNADRIHHTIGQEKHGFQNLLEKRGFNKSNLAEWGKAEEALAQEIQEKFLLQGDFPKEANSGKFIRTITIDGHTVEVTGAMHNGVPKVGTTYIPAFKEVYRILMGLPK